ncbi:MAG: hypothetical protein WCA31_08245 [Acidimicrobiales bacterium]
MTDRHAQGPTWEEYLATAAHYLTSMRATVASGATPPEAPVRPQGPCPSELYEEARLLRLGFDQLALEVTEHLATLEAHLTTTPRSPFVTRALGRYLDTPV